MLKMMNHKHSTRFRWVIVALLFFITIINYVDRSSIAYALDNIAQEFHLSHEQCGFILGSFGIGYFLTTFLGAFARCLTLSRQAWRLQQLGRQGLEASRNRYNWATIAGEYEKALLRLMPEKEDRHCLLAKAIE